MHDPPSQAPPRAGAASSDRPSDAASNRAADVSAVDIMLVLRTSKSAFYAARAAGKIPFGDRPTPGGQSRYSPELAAKIVREHGRAVPRAWGAS